MDLKWHPSIKPEIQAKILAMSEAELIIEIERAPNSLNPATLPFLKVVLAERQAERERLHNEKMLAEASRSSAASARANRLSILAIIIALIALAFSVYRGA